VWWEWAPRVVAEALVPVPDPLRAILVPGPPAAAHDVAAALASALAPPTAADTPPPWLDPAQAKAFQLLLHALRAHGAALCAESAGSGKTYIALAVARALCAEPPACLVPAALVVQWTATARRLDIPAVIWSHSQLSRGRLPPGSPPMVIIDESHHFRNPTIRRYRTLAPWLIGRRVLLVSATPVVNRPTDLYHQLHLGLRDDVLATDGAPSLRTAFDRGAVPGSLGRFVIQHLEAAPGPRSREREERRESGGAALVPGLNRLHLSTHPEFAALIRTGLLCSAASSARALAASLRRYRSLLLQAGDAARAVIESARGSSKPVIACWMGEQQVAEARTELVAAGIPAFRTPEPAVETFAHVSAFYRNQRALLQVPGPRTPGAAPDLDAARLIGESALAERRTVLSEMESKALLAAFHIPVAQTVVAHSAHEAMLVAEEIGYPVALKVDSPDITHKSDVDGVRLGLDRTPSGVELTVEDSGPGIEPELLDEAFDPFFEGTPDARAVGLGLPICLRIVAEHGGQLHVQTRPHVGTRVCVLLPEAASS